MRGTRRWARDVRRAMVAGLAAAALLPALSGAAGERRSRDAARDGVVVRYLGNEGFAIEAGGKAVLIDALQTVGSGRKGELPAAVYARMLARRPPFAVVPLVLVSHLHADHHVPSVAARFLQAHRESSLAATADVLGSLRNEPEYPAIRGRLREVRTTQNGAAELRLPGLSVEFFELPHVAREMYPGPVVAHLVQVGGKRILHVGDAEMSPEQLQGLGLAARRIDLAILPYWVFTRPGARAFIEGTIGARKVIPMRLPMGDLAEARRRVEEVFPGALVLTAPMQAARI
jgi:L-ascorbate metabolism protein UlaG (beta-lactamase superfamily)